MKNTNEKKFVIPENDKLDLPFIPPELNRPIVYSWIEMFMMCEKILPYLNRDRDQKLARALPVREFVLSDKE